MGDTTLDIFGHDADPFGVRNALKVPGIPGVGHPGRAQAEYPPLPADEAAPLKEGLLNRTISGLHYVGSTLDKAFGARALRGLAAGKAHELYSLIPGSDTMGLTRPEDAVSMDDLLTKHYHVFRPNDPNRWEFRDFAVPALEIAADPGTWIAPFGAATKAGRLATGLGHTEGWTRKMLTRGFDATEEGLRAAGHGPEAIAHMANAGANIARQPLLDAARAAGTPLGAGTPLRGALGLGLPFREASGAIGTGRLAQGLAGLQDRAGDALARSYPVRTLRPLFDPSVMRAEDPAVQAAASRHGMPAREAMQSTTRAGEYDLRTRHDRLMEGFRGMPGVENEAMRLLRGSLEGASPVFSDRAHWQADLMRRHGTTLAPGRTLATGVTDPAAVANHVLAHWDEIQAMGGDVRRFGEDILRHAQDVGVASQHVNDLYAHYGARRYIGAAPGLGGTDVGRQFPTTHASNMHRQSPLRDVPGGSEMLDEWAINPALSGPARTNTPAQVHAHVLADMTRHEMLIKGVPTLDPLDAARLDGKAAEVADWLGRVPAVHAEKGVPYFNPDVIGDYAMRGQRHAQVAGSAAASVEAMARMARPTAEFAATGTHHVPLGDFVRRGGKAGLDTFVRAAAGGGDEWHGAGMRLWEKMAPKGLGPVAVAQAGYGPGAGKAAMPFWQAKLNEHAISAEQADQVTRFLQGWTTPTEMRPILGPLAGAHQFFKNMVYPLWPASHFRNATSAAWNNFLHGTNLGDHADAARILRSGAVKDPARYTQTLGMSPQDAAHHLNRGAYADAKVYSGINSYEEHVGGRGLADERLTKGLMGEERLVPSAPGVHEPLGRALTRGGPLGMWNPLGQAGVGGRTADTFAPLVLGRRVGTGVEDYMRLSNYLGNLRRGLSSGKAGQLTRDIHFDYANMTPFERNVMKQVVPFYTFMKNNLPFQANMALTRPGSVAPVLHAMGATNPSAPWVPEYLASSAAIPMGPEQDGTQRYLGSFGLPLEEAFQRFRFKNYELPGGRRMNLPSLGSTARTFLGDASPYLKAPVEFMTNTQFKTGRPLDELYSKGLAGGYGALPEEYAQPLTHLVANSPLARVTSSLNTALDRKGVGAKAINLLTGARITDVDMDRQRGATMRAEVDQLLAADPRIREFVNYYVNPEDKSRVTPDLAARLRLFGTLKGESKAFHRQQADREKLRALSGNAFPGL